MPGDYGVESFVERGIGVDGVQAHAVAELAEPRCRGDAFGRGEVVEDRLGHEEVRRGRALLRLELGHSQRCVEREVDVVAQQKIASLWRLVEVREPVAACAGGVQ